MGARVAPLKRAVVLSAGRASRLSGVNKLLVKAAGKSVLEWHERAFSGWRLDAVVRVDDVVSVLRAGWRGGTLVGTDQCDGPAGALRSYVEAAQLDEPIVVVFADTLLVDLPAEVGDWVGTAPAPWRVWDYRLGDTWVRGVPTVEVCVGLYRFDDAQALRESLNALPTGTEVPMTALLREYEKKRRLSTVLVRGWQDAGDREALAKVKG